MLLHYPVVLATLKCASAILLVPLEQLGLVFQFENYEMRKVTLLTFYLKCDDELGNKHEMMIGANSLASQLCTDCFTHAQIFKYTPSFCPPTYTFFYHIKSG